MYIWLCTLYIRNIICRYLSNGKKFAFNALKDACEKLKQIKRLWVGLIKRSSRAIDTRHLIFNKSHVPNSKNMIFTSKQHLTMKYLRWGGGRGCSTFNLIFFLQNMLSFLFLVSRNKLFNFALWRSHEILSGFLVVEPLRPSYPG